MSGHEKKYFGGPALEINKEFIICNDSSNSDDLLINSKHKNFYIAKVLLINLIYTSLLFVAIFSIGTNIKMAVRIHKKLNFTSTKWVFMSLSLFIKIFFGYFSFKSVFIGLTFFIIDLMSTFLFVFGLCFYETVFYVNRGNETFWVLVSFSFMIIITATFFIFTLNTKKTSFTYSLYRCCLGAVLTTVYISILALAKFRELLSWNIFPLLILAISALSFYFSTDLYFILKYKSRSLNEKYPIQGFHRLWTDVFLVYWLDLLLKIKKSIQRKLMNRSGVSGNLSNDKSVSIKQDNEKIYY